VTRWSERPLREKIGWSLVPAVLCVAGGLLAAALYDSHHEWPYYLAILGSGIAFLACAWVPRPWALGPLRLVIAALAFWMYSAGLLVDLADQNDSLGLVPVSIGVFGVGVVVFFGVLFLPREGDEAGLSDHAMRHAIAAAFFAVFLALLSIGVFHEEWNKSAIGTKLADDLTKWFGVVVAFYFTSTAAVEIVKFRETQLNARAEIAKRP
jgi:NADH:ubiquinone oxidoreductase subunit 6 (subunit J)